MDATLTARSNAPARTYPVYYALLYVATARLLPLLPRWSLAAAVAARCRLLCRATVASPVSGRCKLCPACAHAPLPPGLRVGRAAAGLCRGWRHRPWWLQAKTGAHARTRFTRPAKALWAADQKGPRPCPKKRGFKNINKNNYLIN